MRLLARDARLPRQRRAAECQGLALPAGELPGPRDVVPAGTCCRYANAFGVVSIRFVSYFATHNYGEKLYFDVALSAAVLEGHLLVMGDNYIEVLELPSLRVVQVRPAVHEKLVLGLRLCSGVRRFGQDGGDERSACRLRTRGCSTRARPICTLPCHWATLAPSSLKLRDCPRNCTNSATHRRVQNLRRVHRCFERRACTCKFSMCI